MSGWIYLCAMRKWNMDELGRKSVEAFKQAGKTPLVLVLDNIRSMHNVGSIFRSADAFLIEAIYLCGYTPRPPHRDINKTALGATETVTWKYADTTVAALAELKKEGYMIYGVEQAEGSISLEQFSLRDAKTALVLGNEVEGVSDDALALCDGCIEIPQMGSKHSLNVSVAAGIVLWKAAEGLLISKQ
ncbi:MAG: RNA methyltransferase [Sediminibacterium sp.]|nr:RNA methyltransferase [Sediminibacterium sp.]